MQKLLDIGTDNEVYVKDGNGDLIKITADGGLNFASPNDIALQETNDTETAITTTIFPGGFADTWASVTFNTTKENEWVLVGFHARVKHPPGSGEGILVAYQLDGGSDIAVTSSFFPQSISQTSPNCHFTLPVQVAAAGSHTLKIRSRTFSGGGNGEVNSQDGLALADKRAQLYVLNIDDTSTLHNFNVSTDTDTANLLINSGSYMDAGLQVTVNTTSDNETVLIGYAGSAQPNANGLCTLEIAYQVDGGSDIDVYRITEVAEAQRDVSFMLPIVIPTAGSHTIKLRAKQTTNTWDFIGSAATYSCINTFWAVKLTTNGSKRFDVTTDVETADQTISTAYSSWQTLNNSVTFTTTKTDEVVLIGYVGIANSPTATFNTPLGELHAAYRVDGGSEAQVYVDNWNGVDIRPFYFTNVLKFATPGSHTVEFRARKVNSGATTADVVLYGSTASIPNAATLFAIRFAGSVITLGDNMGDHTATQDVNMDGYEINNVSRIGGDAGELKFDATALNFKRVETAISYQTNKDFIVEVTDTSAPRTITLASADVIDGRYMIIKDASGGAGTNNITIATEGAETIDGAASILIDSDYGAAFLYSDGTDWYTIPVGGGGGPVSNLLNTHTTSANYSTTGEDMIFVDDVTSSRTITLSTADVADGKVIGVKDISGGDISGNATIITIATQGAELIDGQASIDITTDYGYLEVVSDGTNWWIK